MSTIVTRAGKGSPLTHNEVDANFNNLNSDKYQSGDSPTFVTVNATTVDATNVEVTNVKAKDGTAAIVISDTSGNVGIGGAASAAAKVEINGNLPSSSAVSRGYYGNGTIPSGTTTAALNFSSAFNTTAASFTLTDMIHFNATQPTLGAGSTVTNLYGFAAQSSLGAATNNYGFYSNIASASGRYNFYAAGTADNYFAGNVGIGTASPGVKLNVVGGDNASFVKFTAATNLLRFYPYYNFGGNNRGTLIEAVNAAETAYADISISGSTIQFLQGVNTERMRIDSSGNVGIGATTFANTKFRLGGTLPSSSTESYQLYADGVIPSGSTLNGISFFSNPTTAAASFTLTNLQHFYANQGGIGAGSAVTNQYGFHATSSMTGATNNYGFYSNIASGSNRWNFYAAGTADNYFAGNTAIGGGIDANHRLKVENTGAVHAQLSVVDNASYYDLQAWNKATSGDNKWISFLSDAGATLRGSIDYDRSGGLVRYNTTSDYRAKTITGPVTNSGELVDALKVYVGKMNGATIERPMLIAHEAQEIAPYAVSGEKDAVDKDGNPVYQQIDVSSLVPLLIAEIKSLRQRVAELEAK